MTVESPTVMQILVAWRDNKWVVERNGIEVGAYLYRVHAIEQARGLTAEAVERGLRCYMLVKDKAGRWAERSCPKPARQQPPA
jgi:hypothetical protein